MRHFLPPRRHRTLFLSDMHLGSRGCRPDRILDFLRENTASEIYLVGDILDLWHPPFPQWGPVQDQVLALLVQRAQEGVRIVYLLGNHDRAMQAYLGEHFGRITVAEEAVHHAADGRKHLVVHGDIADARVLRWHILTRLGSRIDWALRHLDDRLKRLRRTAVPEQRSVIEAALSGITAALALGTGYETRLATRARKAGCDGVICGHFHKPALHDRHGILYANCGDWVDSFTALAEDDQGGLALLGAPEAAVVEPGFAEVLAGADEA